MNLYAMTTQEILDRISRHCPRSLSTYLQCLNRSHGTESVFFSRSTVEIDMSESWTTFKNNLKKLAIERLLEWHPMDDGIAVTLAEIDEDE